MWSDLRLLLVSVAVGLFSLNGASVAAKTPSPASLKTDVDASPEPATRVLPELETVALPEERSVLITLGTAMHTVDQKKPAAVLATLDQALARLPRPTQLRGLVQMSRATGLKELGREPEAILAAEEAIRLLPNYSGPLLMASELYAYSNRTSVSTDYLLRASEIDPVAVRSLPDYEVDNLIRRLGNANDTKRIRLVSKRLLAIGWTGTSISSRSRLAKAAIEQAVDDGDLAGARQLIPSLVVPGDSYALLMMKRYRPIWSDIEAWAGARLEKQWPTYLEEARSRWEASHDLERGGDYVTALSAARAPKVLIAKFLPLFDTPHDADLDWPLMFIASHVGSALMAENRAAEAIAMFDRAAETWPLGSSANALNIAANRGSSLLSADRPAEALTQLDLAIADTHRWGSEVNVDAVAAMQRLRACALHELHRDAEAAVSATIAGAGHAIAQAKLDLCMGEISGARDALIAGLAQPSQRESIVGLLQPDGSPISPTNHDRLTRMREDALRNDPAVRAAIAPFGRVLDFAANAAAPDEPL